MDKIKNEINEKRNINRIKEEIQNNVLNFCIDNDIENIKNEAQNVYSCCWSFVGSLVFPNNFFIVGFNRGMPIYDYFLLLDVLNVYSYFCRLHNKLVSVFDFSELVRIDYTIIKGWSISKDSNLLKFQILQDVYKIYFMSFDNIDSYNLYINKLRLLQGESITTLQGHIFYKLHSMREENAKNLLISNKNPVALLSVVNKEYLWNIEQTKEELKAKALTIQELPKLDILCKQDEITTTKED